MGQQSTSDSQALATTLQDLGHWGQPFQGPELFVGDKYVLQTWAGFAVASPWLAVAEPIPLHLSAKLTHMFLECMARIYRQGQGGGGMDRPFLFKTERTPQGCHPGCK